MVNPDGQPSGMTSQPKVIYLVTEDWYFWSHRLSLAQAAREQGYKVYVLTTEGDYAEGIRQQGFTLVPVRLPRSIGSPLAELGGLLALVRCYRAIKPDLVHHVALKAVLIGSLAAWLARIPRVINAYTGLGYLFVSSSYRARLVRTILFPLLGPLLRSRRCHSIVQNTDDESLLTGAGLISMERVSRIRGSGVDTAAFDIVDEEPGPEPRVLFASRLLRDKGIYEFIEAVCLLQGNNINARFIVAGKTDPGNPTSISQAEIEAWQQQGLIEWWGERDDMAAVFAGINIVCLPSYREGLPKVLLEAAACGRAIVTTDVPGCREVVADGVNGLLVPLRDVTGLAHAMGELIDHPVLRRQMGKAGRERVVEHFALQAINGQTLDLYNKLMALN